MLAARIVLAGHHFGLKSFSVLLSLRESLQTQWFVIRSTGTKWAREKMGHIAGTLVFYSLNRPPARMAETRFRDAGDNFHERPRRVSCFYEIQNVLQSSSTIYETNENGTYRGLTSLSSI